MLRPPTEGRNGPFRVYHVWTLGARLVVRQNLVAANFGDDRSQSLSQVRPLLDEVMNPELMKELNIMLLRAGTDRNDGTATKR